MIDSDLPASVETEIVRRHFGAEQVAADIVFDLRTSGVADVDMWQVQEVLAKHGVD